MLHSRPMAYLRRTTVDGHIYIYICTSVRHGKKVSGRVLEYLGREDKLDPKRLKRALDYWRVGQKRQARKGGR